jgi:hypothetical protein
MAKAKSRKMTLGDRLAAVDWFCGLMKDRIREEEERGRDDWDRWTLLQMLPMLSESLGNVTGAISAGLPPDDVLRFLANLANYSMIFAHGVDERGLSELRPIVAPPSIPR